MKSFVFNVVSGEEGLRIDKFLSEKLVEITDLQFRATLQTERCL